MAKTNPAILRELSPHRLVLAYAHGAFPMVEDGELMWFCPDPRGLMPLDERFHISARLARTIRAGRFECTINRAFVSVIRHCARRGQGEGCWISPEIESAYTALYERGLAHSIEAWPAGQVGVAEPVGGLYGVTIGGAFFAESMYHTATDAGKVALAFLIARLRERGFVLCDLQWTTDNLRRFGACDIPRQDYLSELTRAISLPCSLM